MLNVIDAFTHECLAIRIDRKLNDADIIDVLSDLFIYAVCRVSTILPLIDHLPSHSWSSSGQRPYSESDHFTGGGSPHLGKLSRGGAWCSSARTAAFALHHDALRRNVCHPGK
jgi:hypothetical protein